MTTDGAALLRAILESPDDDAPRLVYADWLDMDADTLQPKRAEFIRAQCAAARGDVAADRIAQELWTPGSGAYRPQPPGFIAALTSDYFGRLDDHKIAVYRRGFVNSIECLTAAFLEHAPALFAAHPITAVRLTDKRPHLIHDPEDGLCFFTDSGDEPNQPHGLPPEIVIAMRGRRSSPDCPWDSAILFDSLQEATEAISAACVSYGRSLAGLPPLSPREAVEEVARV